VKSPGKKRESENLKSARFDNLNDRAVSEELYYMTSYTFIIPD